MLMMVDTNELHDGGLAPSLARAACPPRFPAEPTAAGRQEVSEVVQADGMADTLGEARATSARDSEHVPALAH